jgi:hypothetical protein
MVGTVERCPRWGQSSSFPQVLVAGEAGGHPRFMSEGGHDPRARFRQLPEPVRPEDVVETEVADPPLIVETPAEIDRRLLAAGGGPV